MSGKTDKTKLSEIVTVGCVPQGQTNGPAAIITGIEREFERRNIPRRSIIYNKKNVFSTVFRIWGLLFKQNATVVVHTNGLLIPKLVYYVSRLNKHNRYFLHVHGLYQIQSAFKGEREQGYTDTENMLLKNFDNIICVSELLKDKIAELTGRTENVFVVRNATDAVVGKVKSSAPTEPIKMISVGGVQDVKGVLELTEIANFLKENGVKFTLDIFGLAEEKTLAAFNGLVKDYGLEDLVVYKGNLSDKAALYQAMESADIQFCLSKWDTFNVGVIESLTLSLPCVCSNMCGASVYIKDGENGLVVDVNDLASTKEKVLKYVKDLKNKKPDVNAKRKAVEEYAQYFSWPAVVDDYLKVLEETK